MGLFRNSADRLPTLLVLASVALGVAAVVGHADPRLLWVLVPTTVLGRFIGPAHQHGHSHLPIFRSRVLNAVYDAVLALGTGNTTAVWELQHGIGHHTMYLEPATDVAGNRRFRVAQGWPLLLRRITVTVLGDAMTIVDAFRLAASHPKKASQRRARLVGQLALHALSLVLLLWVSPGATLLLIVLPAIFFRWMVVWVSFAQHEGTHATNVYDASITQLGPLNRVFLNVGHHTAHHEKPTLHWTLLPARTALIRHRIPSSCVRGPVDAPPSSVSLSLPEASR
jgi:beta-carotene hydroxylase